MDLNDFRRSVCEEWFASSSAFQKHVVYAPLDCGLLQDSPALRALLVLMHHKLVPTPRCSKCRGKGVLLQGRTPNELKWVCGRSARPSSGGGAQETPGNREPAKGAEQARQAWHNTCCRRLEGDSSSSQGTGLEHAWHMQS